MRLYLITIMESHHTPMVMKNRIVDVSLSGNMIIRNVVKDKRKVRNINVCKTRDIRG
jgi:hypothetical protein